MRARESCRRSFGTLSGLAALLVMTACGTADNPYARYTDPPLVRGTLHVVTVAADSDARAADIVGAGYTAVTLAPNYPQANAVEAAIWGVPEPVAAAVRHFKAAPGKPDLRLLVMPLAARGRKADADVDRAFFQNVLGAEVPVWPLGQSADDHARVQAWTYLVPSIVEAAKRLRANGIPVIYDPVAITTSYFGLQKTLAIRAPDGTVVQLVEASAQ